MATTSNLSTLERLYGFRELDEAGYGNRHTITRLIRSGRVPATKIANAFKIRESDLHLLGEPVVEGNEAGSFIQDANDSLGDYVKALVNTFPALNANQKAELGRLLAPAA